MCCPYPNGTATATSLNAKEPYFVGVACIFARVLFLPTPVLLSGLALGLFSLCIVPGILPTVFVDCGQSRLGTLPKQFLLGEGASAACLVEPCVLSRVLGGVH
jgi:hypothetical protein